MSKDIRCLITNNLLKKGEWFWLSWEMDAAISAPGLAELEMRRHDPDDDFAKILTLCIAHGYPVKPTAAINRN